MMANQSAAKIERTLASDFVATASRPVVCRVFDIAGDTTSLAVPPPKAI